MTDISLLSIMGLALVDAVNPCAIAVMAMVLMALLLQNPANRRNIILGGFAFTSAVFILYFIYGLIMVQFFAHVIPETGLYSYYIFKGFGILAILLGLLNLKDYLDYKPGGFMTEMPMMLRPQVKLWIKRITSPKGAFVIGLIVTLFLLPCNIGPYIIASGKLSVLSFLASIPWLLIYNLIFIIPMITITLIIYFGVSTIKGVSGWKEKKIHLLHLVEGVILIAIGIAMFSGLL